MSNTLETTLNPASTDAASYPGTGLASRTRQELPLASGRQPEQLALPLWHEPTRHEPTPQEPTPQEATPQEATRRAPLPSAPSPEPRDFRDAATARLAALWSMAKPYLGRSRMTCPTLLFVRGRLYAGRAHYPDQRIEINEDLLERYPEPMLRETIAHELAHLITQRVHGRRARAHGPEWQQMMRDWFNVEPERTHHFDMTGIDVRRQQRFRYRCECQEHELTSVRHKRARRGTEYRCVHCTGPLTLIDPQ